MTKEALRLALEFLEALGDNHWNDRQQAITAIKAALEAKYEPWEKFCDSHCVWTDHHPDCRLAKDEPVQTIPNFDQLQQIVNNLERCLTRDSKHEFLRVWIRDWTEHKLSKHIPPQRKPLTNEQLKAIVSDTVDGVTVSESVLFRCVARAVEHAHGIIGEYK